MVRPLTSHNQSRWIAFLVVLLVAASLTGCVRRRMTIRSNPPGALVYVDDYEIGTTPISHNFTYYGTRKIRLVKDGYETLTVMQPIRPPWWQIPPIDFVTENVLPGELTDSRTLSYNMSPQRIMPPDELRGRAEQLRSQMQPACYIEPLPKETPTQPTLQPMQPGEMVPMQPNTAPAGTINTPTYTQPGEWIPPGGIAPPNTTTSQPQYYQPQAATQPQYYQPQPSGQSQPQYYQPQPTGQPQPQYYPQPGVQ